MDHIRNGAARLVIIRLEDLKGVPYVCGLWILFVEKF